MQERVTHYSVIQSTTELTLGSILHALYVPLGGHALSLNQAVILTLAVQGSRSRLDASEVATKIAMITASVKSLSPIGTRVTPMLAISVQGLLFALGILVAGPGLCGILLGGALLSTWAFLQPLLIAYFIFGSPLVDGISRIIDEGSRVLGIQSPSLLGILILLMLIKIVIWVGVGGMAWRTGISFEARYLDLLQRVSKKLGVTHTMEVRPLPRSRAQRWNPWFIGATLLSFGVFLITSRPSWVEFAFYALRVIASGILVVWVLKVISRWFPGFGAIGQPR